MNAAIPLSAFLLLTLQTLSADVPEKPLDPKSKSRTYESTSAAGLRFQYFIPRSYDPEKGAPLTVILHGSNLDRRWGFANHKPGDFRPDDILLSPDGTTPNGNGGFNFLGRPDDAEKLAALVAGLTSTLKTTALYLYGHSQGSFFALYFAGQYPDLVHGVLAHASGAWTQTKLPPTAHHQAIVLMHGTADPVVPYTQSLGAYDLYRQNGYPLVRMRSLEGWNHWPAEHNGPVPHVSQQLAWIEGMTAADPVRLTAAYATLTNPRDKSQHDFAALYQVATRLANLEQLPARAREASARSAKSIESLAEQHATTLKLSTPTPEPDGASWIGHLPMFLRAFAGLPAADRLATEQKPLLDAHDDAAAEHFRTYWTALKANDTTAAFNAGLDLLRNAYLSVHTTDPTFLANMKKWSTDRTLEIPKDDLKAYKSLSTDFIDSLKKGRTAFESTNRRAKL